MDTATSHHHPQQPPPTLTLLISHCLETRLPLETIFTPDIVETRQWSWQAILACYGQVVAHRCRRNFKLHKARIPQYVQTYMNSPGLSIMDIAQAVDHSPWLLAREMVLYMTPNSDTSRGKKLAMESLRNVDMIENERLKQDVKQCMEVDMFYSPYHDRASRAAGLQYEYKLQRELTMLGVAFESEEALRRRGFSKTPDVLLVLPIALSPNPLTSHEHRVVRWIDSKAMYGDLVTHNEENREQLQSYVNRFGPGLVVYWMGFDPEICGTYPDVTVEDHVPNEFTSLL